MVKAVMPKRRFASLNDAAEYAALNPKTLRRWVSDGKLTGYRIGRSVRIDLNEIDALTTKIPLAPRHADA